MNSLFAYLEDIYAPVDKERDFFDLEKTVIGEIPKDLSGSFVQNNPNPSRQPDGLYHWFDGDGMVHGVHINEGTATYRNRFVDTEGRKAEMNAGANLWKGILEPIDFKNPLGPDKDTANTDLVYHNGKLLAMWWLSGTPYALDPQTFETQYKETFKSTLPFSFAAHPKVDPRTGELIFFSYNPYAPPYLQAGIINRDGICSHQATLQCPDPSLFHDIAITENHTIFLDLPMVWQPEKIKQGKRRVAFHKDRPSRFGVMPRYDDGSHTKWFELPACYIYHTINAYEHLNEKGELLITMTACRIEDPLPSKDHREESHIPRLFFLRLEPFLYEFTFNMTTGVAAQKQLDDYPTEFPRCNDLLLGKKSQWAYLPRVAKESTLMFDGFIKYNTQTGTSQHVVYGDGRIGGETVFVPKGGTTITDIDSNTTQEDDGYVLTFVRDRKENRSELVIYDAKNADLLTQIVIPHRVPFGFHSHYCDFSNPSFM